MGLTINYTLSTRRRLKLAAVKELTEKLHAKAAALGFERVGDLMEVGPDYTWAFHWPRGVKKISDLLAPAEGWVFDAIPGDGCESAQIGLCRYEGVPGWRLRSYCKTQYASRHGWEHFLKCHRAVVELLWAAEDLGLGVSVDDAGNLWKTGSHKVLRQNLEQHDRCIAAFGGALKDLAESVGETIDAPIFDHPKFEHLEAAGITEHGAKIARAVRAVRGLIGEAIR